MDSSREYAVDNQLNSSSTNIYSELFDSKGDLPIKVPFEFYVVSAGSMRRLSRLSRRSSCFNGLKGVLDYVSLRILVFKFTTEISVIKTHSFMTFSTNAYASI